MLANAFFVLSEKFFYQLRNPFFPPLAVQSKNFQTFTSLSVPVLIF